MKKKVCAFLIALCLLCVNVDNVYASSGQIIVGGSAVAVGGLGAVGLAGLSGPVVIAVFCGLMAFGFNVELTKQSEAAGMSKTDFVQSKIEEYCQEANKTVGVFNDAILSGMEILNDGRIALSDQAAKQIKQFGNWLVDTNQVREPTTNFNGSTVTLGQYTFPVSNTGQFVGSSGRTFRYDANTNVAWLLVQTINSNSYVLCTICNQSYTLQKYVNNTFSSNLTVNERNGYYYTYPNYTTDSDPLQNMQSVTAYPVIQGRLTDFLDTLDGNFDITAGDTVADDSFTGDKDDWASGNNALDPAQDKTTTIDPGLLGQLAIPQDTSIEWDWQKYLDAIKDILDKAKDDTNDTTSEATDTATDTSIPITIDPAITVDPTIAKDDDSSLPPKQDRTPVIDKNEPVSDPDLALEPLKFDLRNIFPFCIPWDFKDLLSKLNADPVAPSYHVHWHVPFVNQYIDFTVDLSGWNDTAAILRKMELFAFCVGLVLATRQMFIRS